MLQEPANEGQCSKCTGAQLLSGTIPIAKRHSIVLDANDPVVRERDPEDVGCQIFERCGTTPDGSAVHNPWLLPDFSWDVPVEVRLLEGRTQLGSKQKRQRLGRNQEGRVARLAERTVRCERHRRHQIVDMRVKAHVARLGLEHPDHANLPAQEARILGKLLQRGSGGAKQERIERARVVACHRAERGGQREGDQKVGRRQ